jgi:hypothetical protein
MLIRDIVDVQLKQYRADQRWFPMGSTYRRTFDGNFNSEERITVTEAAFNEEIPKKVFTLAGINPPAGTLAGVEGSNIRHEWDGTSLVKAKSREKFTFESAVDAPVRSYRTLYTVLAIALALGAGFLGLWYYRRKGSPGVIKGTE